MSFGALAAGKGKAVAPAPATAPSDAASLPSLEAGPSSLPPTTTPALPDAEPSLIQKIMADKYVASP